MNTEVHEYSEVSILLVEDDDVDAMAVERALRQQKIINPLQRARDGVEGMKILHERGVSRPYMILLDINMPRMNGIEMLTSLRSDPTLCDSVVFILTTSKSDEDVTSAYRKHVAGYILKQELCNGFLDVVKMLDQYWRIVVLPS